MVELIILGIFIAVIIGLMFKKVGNAKNGKSCCK